MLLRLLPNPTPEQPAPPTILFTLPLPVNPYTSKSLPLPSNLLTHRSLCIQEGIDCSNTLLGDKANWIAGIVDEVTFDLSTGQITAHLIDGTHFSIPIFAYCSELLTRVIHQVQLSFSSTPPTSPTSIVRPPNRRSPSGLLYTLLSPLLAQHAPATIMTPIAGGHGKGAPLTDVSRLHRRQARSLLVDAYRRYVLPYLKDQLPATYLAWMVQSELRSRQSEWEGMNTEMDEILETSGCSSISTSTPMSRNRYSLGRSSDSFSESSSSVSSSWHASNSSDEDEPMPLTPTTSVWNHSPNTSSPLSQLAGLPVASMIPYAYRTQYSNLVSQMASVASRIGSLKKLRTHVDREQGRRRWLLSLEASRNLEKSSRRAWSNRTRSPSLCDSRQAYRPIKTSPLWRSVSSSAESSSDIHPAMMDDVENCEQLDEFAADIAVRPISPSELGTFNGIEPPPQLLPSLSSDSIESEEPVSTVRERSQVEIMSPSPVSVYEDDRVWKISETEFDLQPEMIVSSLAVGKVTTDHGHRGVIIVA